MWWNLAASHPIAALIEFESPWIWLQPYVRKRNLSSVVRVQIGMWNVQEASDSSKDDSIQPQLVRTNTNVRIGLRLMSHAAFIDYWTCYIEHCLINFRGFYWYSYLPWKTNIFKRSWSSDTLWIAVTSESRDNPM